MIKKLLEYLENKSIVILGFGREGRSTYQFIRKHFPQKKLVIIDQNVAIRQEEILKMDNKIEIFVEEDGVKRLEEFDLIIKSPGISFKEKDISKIQDKIVSQLELLLQFVPIYTIGVTGTKGKSTTSSLIYQMLIEQNIEAKLIGNIGKPAFDEIENLKENMKVVIEMSSHQLEYMDVSPTIAILLNIFEEHLDHYNSFEDYKKAKFNITKFQTSSDYFIYNGENREIQEMVEKQPVHAKEYKVNLEKGKDGNEKVISIYRQKEAIWIDDEKVYDENLPRKLMGNHNLNDIMFVLGVSQILGLNLNQTVETITHFEGLAHRLELVGTYEGITYYNDSIATIPESTINSIEALKKVTTLIIGGMDRKIDYRPFIKYINTSQIENLICLPDTGWKIAKEITNPKIRVFEVENIEEAVKVVKQKTKKDTICLLSPAAASYGFFKNFEERGNLFKKLVKK